jgi:hypothetical protein
LPFKGAGPASRLKIKGKISRVSGRLSIHYNLFGNITGVDIPAPADIPSRKNALWEETCFEFFIAVKGSSPYREVNLSPAGNWNVFCFDAYRKGMREDAAFGSLPFSVRRQPGSLSLFLEFELGSIIRSSQIMNVGISAVIRFKNGQTGYWSLAHRDQMANFHLRDSFVIEL